MILFSAVLSTLKPSSIITVNRHVVTSPSEFDSYSGSPLAGLFDALYEISSSSDEEDIAALWRQFEEHLAAVTHLVTSAGSVLSGRLW